MAAQTSCHAQEERVPRVDQGVPRRHGQRARRDQPRHSAQAGRRAVPARDPLRKGAPLRHRGQELLALPVVFPWETAEQPCVLALRVGRREQ